MPTIERNDTNCCNDMAQCISGRGGSVPQKSVKALKKRCKNKRDSGGTFDIQLKQKSAEPRDTAVAKCKATLLSQSKSNTAEKSTFTTS
jgi:hypothetical protein